MRVLKSSGVEEGEPAPETKEKQPNKDCLS